MLEDPILAELTIINLHGGGHLNLSGPQFFDLLNGDNFPSSTFCVLSMSP